jgi:hypothetical protein
LSAPNLHVSIFCFVVIAEAGVANSSSGNIPASANVRSMVIASLAPLIS